MSDGEVAPSRDVLASILRHAPDFLTHITTDGRFLYLNRIVEGLEAADLEGKTIYDFTDPQDHPLIRETVARVVETGTQQHYETIGVGPNLQRAHYFTRVAPIHEGDVVTSLVLIATDVTRLKETEAALVESQALLQHVLEAAGMGMWWWDPETHDSGNDEVTAELFGRKSLGFDEVIAHIYPDDRDRVRVGLERAAKTGVYPEIEHRIMRDDGTTRWVRASARMFGERRRLIGGVIDVTARKRLEDHVAQAQRLEGIGRLAGGIAHDFNNMLTAILSYTELAQREVEPGSRLARDLHAIESAANRSVALTSQLLAFARQQMIEPKVWDLNLIVEDVERLLRRVLGEDVEVVTVLDAREHVRIDADQFGQVLVNLATNARDAMPNGGRLTIATRDVDLSSEQAESYQLAPGRYVHLAVTDNGHGIAVHELGQIFEPFFTTKARGKGTGLGLAMVYGVVRQNRGHITVHSEPGRTSFEIYLPVATGEVVTEVAPSESVAAPGDATILIAEDDAVVRTIAVEALTRAGYRVLEASNGADALDVARSARHPIDLLITDVVMPKLGGRQLADQLRASQPEIRILYISGYTDNSVVHHGIVDAGIDLLQKPFTPTSLIERIRKALER